MGPPNGSLSLVDGRPYLVESPIVNDSYSRRPWIDAFHGGMVESKSAALHVGKYAMGYAGHGVQMATSMGRQMAEYMSGVAEANIWRDYTFRRIPGHFGPPWFLPIAGAYYKFKDRVS
jgi:hypothetical protein